MSETKFTKGRWRKSPRTVIRAECACASCVQACEDNPGWMTPQEARRAIDDGLAQRLMLDWLEPCDEVGNDERIYVLAPAAEGCEGDYAPEMDFFGLLAFSRWTKGRCVFLNANSRCELHDSGYKPIQCATGFGCRESDGNSNYDVARLWDSDDPRALVARWREAVGL